MKLRIWLATSYVASGEWYYVAAPTREGARLLAAREWGVGERTGYADARAIGVRPNGDRMGRGYRGPQATVEADAPRLLTDQEIEALGVVYCDRCDLYRRPNASGECADCAEDDAWWAEAGLMAEGGNRDV